MSRLIQYTLCVLFLITVGLAASVEDSVVFKVAFGIGKKQQVGGEMSKIDVLVDMDGVLWIPE